MAVECLLKVQQNESAFPFAGLGRGSVPQADQLS